MLCIVRGLCTIQQLTGPREERRLVTEFFFFLSFPHVYLRVLYSAELVVHRASGESLADDLSASVSVRTCFECQIHSVAGG